MSDSLHISFVAFAAPSAGAMVVFAGASLKLGARTTEALAGAGALVGPAAETLAFTAKTMSAMDLVRPAGLAAERLLVVGTAAKQGDKPLDFFSLGGFVAGKLPKTKAI